MVLFATHSRFSKGELHNAAMDILATHSGPSPRSHKRFWVAAAGAVCVGGGMAAAWPIQAVAIVAAASAFAFACSPRRLLYVLVALALYTPFEEFALKWVPEQLYLVARFGHYAFVVAVFLVLLGQRFLEGRPLVVWSPVHAPLLVFIGVSVVASALGEAPLSGAAYAYQPLLRFVFVVFIPLLYVDLQERDVKWVAVLLLTAAFGQACIALAQYIVGPSASEFLSPAGGEFGELTVGGFTQEIYEEGGRIFGTLGRYNTLGAFLGIHLLLAFPFVARRAPSAVLLASWCVPVAACIVLAGARSPLMGLAAGVWVILCLRKSALSALLPFGSAALLFLVLPWVARSAQYIGIEGSGVLQRLIEPFSPQYQEVSTEFGRLYFIAEFPFDMMRLSFKEFLFGFGPGSLGLRAIELFDLHVLDAVGVRDEEQRLITDVNWAYLFGQAGLLGFGAFAWVVWRLLRTSVGVYRAAQDESVRLLALGTSGVIVMISIVGLFYPAFEIRAISLYLWFLGGLVTLFALQSSPDRERWDWIVVRALFSKSARHNTRSNAPTAQARDTRP